MISPVSDSYNWLDAGLKKETTKSLSEEVEKLKEQMKEMDYLKQNVIEMERDHTSEMTWMKNEIKELEGIIKDMLVKGEPPVKDNDEDGIIKSNKIWRKKEINKTSDGEKPKKTLM